MAVRFEVVVLDFVEVEAVSRVRVWGCLVTLLNFSRCPIECLNTCMKY